MPLTWTPDQILAFAPDASSAKAGQGLASPRKWLSLGYDERATWGECQGSASEPYRTRIDLSEPAFHCSCPSRKFPCKHALGLFLLLASQPTAFKQNKPPAWVTEWLASRVQRAERVQQRAKKKAQPEPVTDARAQTRRAEQREDKIAMGLGELELWLADLVRQGLASASGQPVKFWEAMAARMVDAQAPGVARQLREMAGIAASGEGWQERLLERLARLHLLIEGYKRIETLSPETQADIRTLVGWTYHQDKLLSQEGVLDNWLILGQRVEEEERLRVQRTWLWGRESYRAALILDLAMAKQPLEVSLAPGMCLEAGLVYFPSNYPLRALVKTRHASPTSMNGMPGFPNVSAAMSAYADALARNPWIEEFPMPLQAVVPAQRGDRWFVRDEQRRFLPLARNFEHDWPLMALSGGHALAVFGEWDGECLLPLSAWAEDRFIRL